MRPLCVSLVFLLTATAAGAQTAGERAALIARAQVWEPSDIPAKDLRAGPPSVDGFAPGATVHCDYAKIDPDGNSPKFKCQLSPGDEVKVKYGSVNGEVYGEVAATRLLWALGFGADRMYPVRVICRGCPTTIGEAGSNPDERIVDPAAIERRFPGRDLDDMGSWSWGELDLIDEDAGAPRSHRDALKLLAVMLQHSDNKPEQQRLVCLDQDCRQPFMMLNDVGLTFGRASFANDNARSSVNLAAWTAAPVWKGSLGCIGNLPRSFTGTLRDPIVSEAGRRFLADLLAQLSDDQLRALFTVAQVDRRPLESEREKPRVDDWVRAFRGKQAEIAERRCPASWSAQAPPLQGTGHIVWLQSWSSTPLTVAMNAISLLGYPRVYLFIALLIAVSVRLHAGAALLLVVAMTSVLTDAAKTAGSLPRPDAVDSAVRTLSLTSHLEVLPPRIAAVFRVDSPRAPSAGDEDSYGFPSGHVATATAFLLGLRLLAGWRPAVPILLVWVPLMALSRMYLGRHFAIDVVGGFLIGVVAAAFAWRLRLHLLDHPVRGTNIALRMCALAVLIAVCALMLRMPAAADAGLLLGLSVAILLVNRTGGAGGATVRTRVARAAGASVLLAAGWWVVPRALEMAGESPARGVGAMIAGALPLFIALVGSVMSRRYLRDGIFRRAPGG